MEVKLFIGEEEDVKALMGIRLFIDPDTIEIGQWLDYDNMTPSLVIYCLIHEVLHSVIYKLEGREVSRKLDSLRGFLTPFAIAIGIPIMDVQI